MRTHYTFTQLLLTNIQNALEWQIKNFNYILYKNNDLVINIDWLFYKDILLSHNFLNLKALNIIQINNLASCIQFTSSQYKRFEKISI